MKILLATDSFKGSLSSIDVIHIIEEAANANFHEVEIVKIPIADGGEGTVDSVIFNVGGEYRHTEATGPLGNHRVMAKYGIINGRTAVIEMAQASGLPLLESEQKNPLVATTYGTGEIIRKVLDEGVREFIIGIGGSATNDGGIGAVQALGVRFLDAAGKDVGIGGQALSDIRTIDMNNMDTRIKESTITVMCDVTNPLTGPNGATAIYGRQKGVTGALFPMLESGMSNFADVLNNHLGIDINSIAGAGAAGGLGAALVAFLNAELKPGIETLLDFIGFDRLLEGVDLVITGEGRIDGQSVFGKVPVGVAKRCKKKNIPVIALVGEMGVNARAVYEYGIDSIMTSVDKAMDIEEAMSEANLLLKDAADRMFRMIKIGMQVKS